MSHEPICPVDAGWGRELMTVIGAKSSSFRAVIPFINAEPAITFRWLSDSIWPTSPKALAMSRFSLAMSGGGTDARQLRPMRLYPQHSSESR